MPQVLERVFVDARHGASGFYLLRFFHDDPRSDDDWKVTTLTLTLAPTHTTHHPCLATLVAGMCKAPSIMYINVTYIRVRISKCANLP